MQLSVLAYTLGNLWRRLVLPTRIDTWSLTSGELVEDIDRLVDPTPLFAGVREHFPHRAPEAETAVGNGQSGIDRELAVPNIHA